MYQREKSQKSQNNYLLNELVLINKVVKLNNLPDGRIVVLIKKYGATLRSNYFTEISTGNIFRALGFLNYQVQAGRC